MNRNKHRHVGLLFFRYLYRFHLGIVKYAEESGWILNSSIEQYTKLPDDLQLDGIISHSCGHPDIIDFVNNKKVPTVDLGPKQPNMDVPNVYMDNKAIGEMAGDYLIKKGFENIGFIKRSTSVSCNERYHALKEFVNNKGKTFYTLDHYSFVKKLKDVPKPFAIMGENDKYTSDYMRQCVDAGYNIPYEIAFISVDNDPLYCNVAQIPLTSIDNNLEEVGYRVADLLYKLMDGEPPPDKPILIPPGELVERKSTTIMAFPHIPTCKALEYIWDHYMDKNLSVSEAVKVSGLCRRSLEDFFKKYVGHSMPNEILRLRLTKAKKLLKNSDLKVYEVAEQTGFSTSEQMISVFKRELGTTPKKFRTDIKAVR